MSTAAWRKPTIPVTNLTGAHTRLEWPGQAFDENFETYPSVFIAAAGLPLSHREDIRCHCLVQWFGWAVRIDSLPNPDDLPGTVIQVLRLISVQQKPESVSLVME